MTQTQKNQDFYSKDELCQILKVSRPTLANWFKACKLPDCSIKIGRRSLYPCEQLDAAIKKLITTRAGGHD
ncbi:MAG: helix-turn-helix domain-containing protein [Nitrospirae bacterium]|nr:helix-turn-helix domain-containing protein [Nitrospirota bacterium]